MTQCQLSIQQDDAIGRIYILIRTTTEKMQ